MDNLVRYLKRYWLVVISILVGFFLRILFLDRIPVSLTGDELVYLFHAKLFILGSQALYGWNPLAAFLFHYPPNVFPQAELPYLIAVMTSFSSSLFIIRLPYALMSVGIIIVLFFLSKELFDEKIGQVVAIVAAVSPWFIVMGRTAYEITPATLFFLLGIYLLLKAQNTKGFILSFLMFLLGFYSYIGTKLVFLPLMIATCIYAYSKNRKYKTQYGIFILTGLVIIAISFLLLHSQQTSRLNELFLPTNPQIAKEVLNMRQGSIPFPFESLVINKLTVYVSMLLNKVIASISPSRLFSYGDMFFGLGNFGLFYILDALFLFIGTTFVFRKEYKTGLYLVSLLFIGLLPQIFYKETNLFTPHISFTLPIMLICIGYGVFMSTSIFPYKKLAISVVGVSYTYFVMQFLALYFFQYPLSPQTDFPTRILSSYIARSDSNTQITVYSNHSGDLYKKYLMYEDRINKHTVSQVDASLKTKEYAIENVRFVSCDTKLQTERQKGIFIIQSQCGNMESKESFHKISLLMDGGEVYKIYHDFLCSSDTLPSYPAKNTLKEFAVEKLSTSEYCQVFISK